MLSKVDLRFVNSCHVMVPSYSLRRTDTIGGLPGKLPMIDWKSPVCGTITHDGTIVDRCDACHSRIVHEIEELGFDVAPA